MIRSARVGQRSVHSSVPVLGYTSSGNPIFGIAGGASDDDDTGGDDEDEDGDEDEDDDEEESKSKSKSKSGGKGKTKSSRDDDDEEDEDDEEDDDEPVTKAELKRMERRMKAADKRADKAERKLREKENEGKDEDEKLQEDFKEVTKERDTLSEENTALSVRLAVLTNAEAGKFHDPEDILRFVDFEDLADEDGEINKKAVKRALKDLAKDKPHLVKSQRDDDEEDEEEEEKKPPPSGRQTNGNKRKGKKDLSREALAKKYPALRR